METVADLIAAVDVLALFAILLLLALRGFTPGQALRWIWNATIHPVENYRKTKRGEWW